METATAAGTEVAKANLPPLRIVVVDDHPTVRLGISGLFAERSGFTVVGAAESSDEAVAVVLGVRPAVVTMDLSMPGDVFGSISTILRSTPQIKIIIFTAYADVDLALRAIDAGAHAFVLKGRPAGDLFDAIAAVSAGERFVSPGFSESVAIAMQKRAIRSGTGGAVQLTPRELEIVDCLFRGMSNKEVARELKLAEKTIKHYMTNLMSKLKVKSRVEVLLALRPVGPSARMEQATFNRAISPNLKASTP